MEAEFHAGKKAEFESELAAQLGQVANYEDEAKDEAIDECLRECLDAVHPGIILAYMQELWIAPELDEYLTCSLKCFPDFASLWPILYAWGDPSVFEYYPNGQDYPEIDGFNT